jgi:hypothetical protein
MNFPHKRNYPEVAYKSHEFFDASLAKPDRMPRVSVYTVYTYSTPPHYAENSFKDFFINK